MKDSAQDLKRWVHQLTGLPVHHLSDLRSGVAFALLAQRLCKVRFPLAKLSREAKNEYECLQNLRVFSDYMHRDHDRPMVAVQISSIAKGRLKDIIELLTWFKRSLARPVVRRTTSDFAKNKSLFIRVAKEESPTTKHVIPSTHEIRQPAEDDEIIEGLAAKVRQIQRLIEAAESREELLAGVRLVLQTGDEIL